MANELGENLTNKVENKVNLPYPSHEGIRTGEEVHLSKFLALGLYEDEWLTSRPGRFRPGKIIYVHSLHLSQRHPSARTETCPSVQMCNCSFRKYPVCSYVASALETGHKITPHANNCLACD